jgi:hypothetical protein
VLAPLLIQALQKYHLLESFTKIVRGEATAGRGGGAAAPVSALKWGSTSLVQSASEGLMRNTETALCLLYRYVGCIYPGQRWSLLAAVLRIRKYFFRIRIRGAVILTYGSGFRRPNNYGCDRVRVLPVHFCAP